MFPRVSQGRNHGQTHPIVHTDCPGPQTILSFVNYTSFLGHISAAPHFARLPWLLSALTPTLSVLAPWSSGYTHHLHLLPWATTYADLALNATLSPHGLHQLPCPFSIVPSYCLHWLLWTTDSTAPIVYTSHSGHQLWGDVFPLFSKLLL